MAKVLVTGGAGFLGSHLCERLLDEGCDVACLDDYSSGGAENVAHLRGRGDFRVVRRDVREPFSFHVDEIYNLACPASPAHYQRDPVRTLQVSFLGALRALELARRTGARVLQASTSEVYGDPLAHPQREDDWGNVNPIGPRACYDEGKRAAEALCFDYRRQHGVDVRVARIFNTYGPRMRADDGRVVGAFVHQALEGRDLTVHGDGLQTRSFCYVDDMVDGLLALMRAPRVSGPVNLGNPEERSVLDLARMVLALTGSASRVVHVPLPADDPRRRRPDVGRARLELGWRPTTSLAEGLPRVVSWFAAADGRARRLTLAP